MSFSKTNPRFCQNCRLAQTECICSQFNRFQNSTKVWLKQDIKEKFQKNNTGFWATQMLENIEFDDQENEFPSEWVDLFQAEPQNYGVLFPNEHSQPLSRDTWGERTHLVVIDATWKRAKASFNALNQDVSVTSYHLEECEGLFEARKAPFEGAISTIEALGEALLILENLEEFQENVHNLVLSQNLKWKSRLKFPK